MGHGIEMHPLVVIMAILGELNCRTGGRISLDPVCGLMIVVYNHYLAYRGLQRAAGRSAPKSLSASYSSFLGLSLHP